MLALAAVLLGAPATASALSGDNLVVNGDAEEPVGNEWAAVQGLGLMAYGYDATVSNVLIGGSAFDGGSAALIPRNAGVPVQPMDPDVTINDQEIDLSEEDSEAIDTGTVRARFSAYIGGFANQADRIGAVAAWRNAAGESVGLEQSLVEVTNVERGNVSGAILRLDEQAVPVGARSVVIRLTGTRVVPPMHNGYIDNIDLRLIGIPRIEKRFGTEVATADTPFRLTYTVRNSGDRGGKPAWSFRDELPEGVRIAPVSRATIDCPAARISATDGRVSLGGAVLAGQETCTAAVDVVAVPGRYSTGLKQLADVVGLRVGSFTGTEVTVEADPGPGEPGTPVDPRPDELPPVEILPFVPPPPAPPASPASPAPPVEPWVPSFARPALRATFQAVGNGTRSAGDRVTLRLRVTNPTTATAARVRACVSLPSGLRLATPSERSVRDKKAKRPAAGSRSARPCWAVGTVEGRGRWETTLTVTVVRGTGATVRPRATVTSPDTVARASATAKVRTVADADDPDEDARRR